MKENLIKIAINFSGTRGFSNFYVEGEDVLKNGELSCSIFVSVVLVMTRIIDGVSYTVNGLLYRIEKSNLFEEIEKPKKEELIPGDLVLWNPIRENGNFHIGIYIGDGIAISNRSSQGSPGGHPVEYTGLGENGPEKASIKKIFRLKRVL
jgi:hypothetical protein